jgi:PhnB protein
VSSASTSSKELWVDHPRKTIEFYAAAFGADVIFRDGTADDIVAQLAVREATFWVGSADPSMGLFSPKAIGGRAGRVLLMVLDLDSVHHNSVRAGATQTSPVSQEHGWRVSHIIDPFGHEWETAHHLAE